MKLEGFMYILEFNLKSIIIAILSLFTSACYTTVLPPVESNTEHEIDYSDNSETFSIPQNLGLGYSEGDSFCVSSVSDW